MNQNSLRYVAKFSSINAGGKDLLDPAVLRHRLLKNQYFLISSYHMKMIKYEDIHPWLLFRKTFFIGAEIRFLAQRVFMK